MPDPSSAHMSVMSIPNMALVAAAAVAVFSLTTTDFSDGTNPVGAEVAAEEREAYEAARFLTPEGKAVAEEGLARITAKTDQATSGADVLNDALLRPHDWPALAQGSSASTQRR